MTDIIPHRKVIVDSGLAEDIITVFGCTVNTTASDVLEGDVILVMWNWWVMN